MLLKSNSPESEPGIHALIVGVGKYEQADEYGLSAELSSACVSAFNFSDFLLNNLRYPNRPWKSADIVISCADDLSDDKATEIRDCLSKMGQWDFQSADFGTVSAAVEAWKVRCDRSEEDVAVLYFCGHGVEWNGVTALILEDFNAQTHGFYKGSVDLYALHEGTAAMRVRNKYFFIDSCRGTPASIMDLRRIDPASVLPRVVKRHSGVAPIYLATRESEKAFGRPNECAQFTSAVISSLKGAGAKPGTGTDQGRWVVTSNSVVDGVDAVLKLKIEFKQGKRQAPDRGGLFPFGAETIHIVHSAKLPARVSWPPKVTGVSLRAGGTELACISGTPPWVTFDLDVPPPLPPEDILAFPAPDTADVSPKPYPCRIDPPVFDYNLWPRDG